MKNRTRIVKSKNTYMNVFYNTIIFVKNIKESKQFYESVIGLKVVTEYDSVVFYENHFVIHDKQKILQTIFEGRPNNQDDAGSDNILIYFETDNIEESFQKVQENGITIIHPIKKQEWGQQVFRFYDPDKYIIEIGEAMHLNNLKPH